MKRQETLIHLDARVFDERERPLLDFGELSASTFRFDSGVAGLRLKNLRDELVLLPFQGQQIWSATLGGRELTMRSMFPQPRPTREYLQTYGGFLLHCGMTAMGVPSSEDNHPPHGEIPNAPYDQAYLLLDEDEMGRYLALGGAYVYTVAFNHNYLAEPLVKLYADSNLVRVSMTVTNLKNTPQELMYLAHINFRPVDNARLVYSAECTPEHVRVRKSIPSHVHPGPEYAAFLKALEKEPQLHHVLRPGMAFDPEVVFSIDYSADADGWAHSMQVHPDGQADYVRHRPDQLKIGVRWICRTPDQDALGLVLPATAEPEGYTAEKAKGNLQLIPPRGSFHCDYDIGVLSPAEAEAMEKKIQAILVA